MKSRIPSALAFALATVLAAGLASDARAQDGSLPVQQFAPAPGGDNNFVTVQGTAVLPSFKPAAGIYLNYAHDPLILRRLGRDEEVSLIEHHLQLDLIAALGILDILEIGLSIPLTLYQTQGDASDTLRPAKVDAFTTGDIRLYPKVSILHDDDGFGLAFLALISLPTGSPENLQGNESVTIEPRLVAQYYITEEFRAALSLGFLWRPESQNHFNIDVGNELTFGAGLEYEVVKDTASILVEGYGKLSLESDTQAEERPVEVSLAGRWWPADAHALTLGVARGLTDGYGSPDFRVYLGYNFTTPRDDDQDGDGLRDSVDRCPVDPEDFDGFQDEDGCPDRDNDKDGVLDRDDQCPLDPEDIDNFEDQNGCPDPDNDKDLILDVDDKCPDEPEDKDGFQDEDGCPDPDNDNDKVLDVNDGPPGDDGWGKCMNIPEDLDNFEDEDGCPDPDNDNDGILDVDDKCPNDATDKCLAVIKGKCEIQILDKVEFKYDSDEIDEKKSKPVLDAVAEVLKSNPWILKIEVQGHTDADGTDKYNLDLSQRRSQSVLNYLADKNGIERGRMVAKGYGESKPIDTNRTPAGRAKNRRVQFFILDPSQENCKQ